MSRQGLATHYCHLGPSVTSLRFLTAWVISRFPPTPGHSGGGSNIDEQTSSFLDLTSARPCATGQRVEYGAAGTDPVCDQGHPLPHEFTTELGCSWPDKGAMRQLDLAKRETPVRHFRAFYCVTPNVADLEESSNVMALMPIAPIFLCPKHKCFPPRPTLLPQVSLGCRLFPVTDAVSPGGALLTNRL